MNCRPGVTLTEVLVAIFITGIGLMSLLVLFPLGALNMAQAIKDQRAADASRIAESLAAALDLRNDQNAFYAYSQPVPLSGSASYIAYIDPQGCRITGGVLNPATPATPTPATSARSVGGVLGFSRCYPDGSQATGNGTGTKSGIDFTSPSQIPRWTTLRDEMTFDIDGAPKTVSGTVEQTPYYSWAWMCQQTKANNTTNPTPTGVNLTVIVYYRRPLLPGGAGLQEEVPCTMTPTGGNTARLSWSAATPPPLKRGTWILDAVVPANPNPQIRGFWYRIVGVTPITSTSADIELHTNARAGGTSTAIVMDSVVEVFEKGQ